MTSYLNTNIASLTTQNNLSRSQSALSQSIQRLSSGLRVNSAKDDAAGFAISNRMDSTIRGQAVAQRNVNDGISMVQTADGALSQINDNLQRMRELAVQAANGTLTDSDRDSLNTEFNNLQQEITRIKSGTKFNGKSLFDGQSTTIQAGAGTSSNDQIALDGIDLTSATSEVNKVTESLGPNSYTAYKSVKDATQAYIDANSYFDGYNIPTTNGHVVIWWVDKTGGHKAPDTALKTSGPTQTQLDAYNTSLNTYLNSASPSALQAFIQAETQYTQAGGTFSNPWTPNGANQSAVATMQTAISTFEASIPSSVVSDFHNAYHTIILQGGFNGPAPECVSNVVRAPQSIIDNFNNAKAAYDASIPQSIVSNYQQAIDNFFNNGGQFLGLDPKPYMNVMNQDVINTFLAAQNAYYSAGQQQGFNLSSQSGATSAIDQIDKAISEVNKASIKCGASENRLSSVISTLQTSTENQAAARSRIMDTDYAAETATMARTQILQQAGMAILAQANQLPNGIMTLLK
jgi:flagellin